MRKEVTKGIAIMYLAKDMYIFFIVLGFKVHIRKLTYTFTVMATNDKNYDHFFLSSGICRDHEI